MKYLFIILVSVIFLINCKKDDRIKPTSSSNTDIIPHFDFSAYTILTIADLKSKYPGSLNLIDTNYLIWGKVTANDESGNFYKTMEIQDASAAIELKLDRSSLFNEFKIGQRIYIKLDSLYIGEYNGLKQIGYNYNNAIGRLPDVLIDKHILLDSLPGSPIEPKIVNINALDEADLSKLVKIEGVSFELPGSRFAETISTTNRSLLDENGFVIPSFLVRTSNYASFAANLLPSGKGNLVGILSRFGIDWHFYIRDINDVQDFVAPVILLEYSFATSSSDWTIKSQASNKDWFYYDTDPCMVMNGVGADVPSKDWLVSPEVDFGVAPNCELTFKTIMKNTDSGITEPLKIKISSNYSGDATTATWTDVPATLSTSGSWASNTVSGFPNSGKYRIAFYYESSGTTGTTATAWQIKDVMLAN
ncbi:MAG: hypothetical protein A2033_06375 [Bacteroidetes bacterium GWA2_31_9]|nr:MAG: hypothetical protein A2033_06375 [Bacteroidetes bacterium GWA2_31_9]